MIGSLYRVAGGGADWVHWFRVGLLVVGVLVLVFAAYRYGRSKFRQAQGAIRYRAHLEARSEQLSALQAQLATQQSQHVQVVVAQGDVSDSALSRDERSAAIGAPVPDAVRSGVLGDEAAVGGPGVSRVLVDGGVRGAAVADGREHRGARLGYVAPAALARGRLGDAEFVACRSCGEVSCIAGGSAYCVECLESFGFSRGSGA